MAERDIGSADALGLADAIGLLRDELLQARAAGAGSDIQLPVESMTVQVKVTAAKSKDGKPALEFRSWTWNWAVARVSNAVRS